MKIFTNREELRKHIKSLKKDINKNIGFVPTMGALHNGHKSLIKKARLENEIIVVSIFVNPIQFLKGEDIEKYPKQHKADTIICKLCDVDILFFPSKKEIYSGDEASILAPKIKAYVLEGASRPAHFDGVLTVVMKLLNIINPDRVYFGKKDAQQLNLISLMVKQFFMNVEIVPVDTIRENDGLALSSRNIYLSIEERQEALKISKSLRLASRMIMEGILETSSIKEKMKNILFPLEISYVEIVDRNFLAIEQVVISDSIILVEAKIGDVRLLDNIWI